MFFTHAQLTLYESHSNSNLYLCKNDSLYFFKTGLNKYNLTFRHTQCILMHEKMLISLVKSKPHMVSDLNSIEIFQNYILSVLLICTFLTIKLAKITLINQFNYMI